METNLFRKCFKTAFQKPVCLLMMMTSVMLMRVLMDTNQMARPAAGVTGPRRDALHLRHRYTAAGSDEAAGDEAAPRFVVGPRDWTCYTLQSRPCRGRAGVLSGRRNGAPPPPPRSDAAALPCGAAGPNEAYWVACFKCL